MSRKKTVRSCVKPHKPVSGKGKLASSMQNYYGMPIRNSVDDIHNMRKATGAALYNFRDLKIRIIDTVCVQIMKIAGASINLIK